MATLYALDVLALNEPITVGTDSDSGRYACQTIQSIKIAYPRELTIGRIAPNNLPDIAFEDRRRIISRKQGLLKIIRATPGEVPIVMYRNLGKTKPEVEFLGKDAEQRKLTMEANESIPIHPGESLTFGIPLYNRNAPFCIVYAAYNEEEGKEREDKEDEKNEEEFTKRRQIVFSSLQKRILNFFKRTGF